MSIFTSNNSIDWVTNAYVNGLNELGKDLDRIRYSTTSGYVILRFESAAITLRQYLVIFTFIFLSIFYLYFLRFSMLWLYSSTFVNSGALIPRRSTAQREGRRISFVRF
jgi:hypothetical protein